MEQPKWTKYQVQDVSTVTFLRDIVRGVRESRSGAKRNRTRQDYQAQKISTLAFTQVDDSSLRVIPAGHCALNVCVRFPPSIWL